MRAGLQITRLTALSELRTCDLRNSSIVLLRNSFGIPGYKGEVKQMGSQVKADGYCERDVIHRMNEGYIERGGR